MLEMNKNTAFRVNKPEIFMKRKSFLGLHSHLKDTVDNQKTKIPEQQDGEDKGRLAHNIPGGFLIAHTPAAPGGGQSQSGRSREY